MLTVNDIMTPLPHTVTPGAPLSQVIAVMKAANCRQLPVVENGRLVGIISDRDVRLAADSPIIPHDDPDQIEAISHVFVADCMTRSPMTVDPETPVHQAADLLANYKFGALPVVDQGALVGIITVTDLLHHLADLSQPEESDA